MVSLNTTFPDFVLCHASTLPSGNAERKMKRTSGPATISWKGRAMIKFLGMLVSQIISSWDHAPERTHPSTAPYMDMMSTIGTTMEQDTQMTFFSTLSSGFTR